MKNLPTLPFTFLILLSAIAAPAQTASQEVQRTDADLNALILGNKVTAAEKYYLEDFVLTTSSGTKKYKTDLMKEIGSADLKLEVNETLDVVVKVVDATAILTGKLHQKGTYKGKAFDVYLWVTDTWVKTSTGWKIFAGHASIINTTNP